MSDMLNLDLTDKVYTPDEVRSVVDRIPNTATTHWNVFGYKVLPAVMNLLLKDHKQAAYDIALAWARRSPKFSHKDFDKRWLELAKKPMSTPGMHTLKSLAVEDGGGEVLDDDGDAALRTSWDALRQACAVIAGKARHEALGGMLKAVGALGTTTSAYSGAVVTVNSATVGYASGWSLDRIVLEFCAGTGKMPRDFELSRLDGGGHRFENDDDATSFSECHDFYASNGVLGLINKTESSSALKPEAWPTIRDQLHAIAASAPGHEECE